MRRFVAALVLGLACASAPAAFTDALGGFQADLAGASAGLAGQTDPVAVKRKKAVDRSLAAVLAYSPSLARDLSTAVKVARLLEKPFPPEDALLTAFDGALDGLAGEVASVRELLAEEDSLLLGAKKAAADAALASVDASIVLADLAATRADRAGLLKKAEHRAAGARKSLRKGAPAGFQGPYNGSFEEQGVNVQAATGWTGTANYPATVSRSVYGVVADGIYDQRFDFFGAITGTTSASIRQSGMLLSQSTRLLFEYSTALNVGQCSSGPDAGAQGGMRIEIQFILEDPAVTVVLWSRDFAGGATTEPVATQAIDLPYLPSPGTLVVKVTSTTATCSPGPVLAGYGRIQVDHLRVE